MEQKSCGQLKVDEEENEETEREDDESGHCAQVDSPHMDWRHDPGLTYCRVDIQLQTFQPCPGATTSVSRSANVSQ